MAAEAGKEGAAGEAAPWGGSIAAMEMAANPFGARLARRVFIGPNRLIVACQRRGAKNRRLCVAPFLA